jgi:hypothetical protein
MPATRPGTKQTDVHQLGKEGHIMRNETDYSYRLHPRLTDDDPELATVMYTTHGIEGPWFDMATCHPDYVWDIVGALERTEETRRAGIAKEETELRAWVNKVDEYDQFENPVTPPNKNDITLVERLRLINPYSPTQVLEVCADAADHIAQLEQLGEALYHDATCNEMFCDVCNQGKHHWEARRG